MYPPFWENFENSIPLSEGMCVCVGERGGGSSYEEHYQNSRKSTIRSADKYI